MGLPWLVAGQIVANYDDNDPFDRARYVIFFNVMKSVDELMAISRLIRALPETENVEVDGLNKQLTAVCRDCDETDTYLQRLQNLLEPEVPLTGLLVQQCDTEFVSLLILGNGAEDMEILAHVVAALRTCEHVSRVTLHQEGNTHIDIVMSKGDMELENIAYHMSRQTAVAFHTFAAPLSMNDNNSCFRY